MFNLKEQVRESEQHFKTGEETTHVSVYHVLVFPCQQHCKAAETSGTHLTLQNVSIAPTD